MTKTYADIKKQIDALQAQANELRAEERAGVVGRIKEAIAHYGITPADLGLRKRGANGAKPDQRATGAGKTAESRVKFADGSGQTWVGRGPRPAWLREALLKGRTLEEFAVGKAPHRKSSPAEPAALAPRGVAEPLSKREPGTTRKPAKGASTRLGKKVAKAATRSKGPSKRVAAPLEASVADENDAAGQVSPEEQSPAEAQQG